MAADPRLGRGGAGRGMASIGFAVATTVAVALPAHAQVPENTACRDIRLHEQPTPLSTFVDSAGVAALMSARPALGVGRIVADLHLDSIDQVFDVSVHTTILSAPARDALAAEIAELFPGPPEVLSLPARGVIDLRGRGGSAPTLLQSVRECYPVLLNADEVGRALREEYPPDLRSQGISGTVLLRIHIDETGAVTETRIDQSAGRVLFDVAAARVGSRMRYAPPSLHGVPMSAWLQQPIEFRSGLPG